MDTSTAAVAFAALGNPSRLGILRTVMARPEGMSAGEIIAAAGGLQNTVSGQLKVLAHAGVLTQERRATQIIYRVDEGVLSALAKLLAL